MKLKDVVFEARARVDLHSYVEPEYSHNMRTDRPTREQMAARYGEPAAKQADAMRGARAAFFHCIKMQRTTPEEETQ